MSALPQPKFVIGDAVWIARERPQKQEHPCPDCLGSGLWSVLAPSGEVFDVGCKTCTHGFDDKGSGISIESIYRGGADPMTVGSIRIDTSHEEDPIEYMMDETGVGSGTIYRESKVFDNREDAIQAGEVSAAALQANITKQNRDQSERRRKQNVRKPWWPKRLEKAADKVCKTNGQEQAKAIEVLRRVITEANE